MTGKTILQHAETVHGQRRHLVWLMLALTPLYLLEISWGLPNRDVAWGYDSNPLVPLIAIKRIFLDGWNTGWHSPYPCFHYYVVGALQCVYMAVEWILGNLKGLDMNAGYPYGVEQFDRIFMNLALIFRLVSVAMALGTVYWTYRIGECLFSHRSGLFAGALVGLSPAVIYYSHTETLDVPMLFWLSAALYCYVRVMQTLQLKYYVALAVLAAVSTATKDYAYGAFVLMPIPLVWRLARQINPAAPAKSLARAMVDRRHWIALGVFILSFAVAENWFWNFSGFVNHVRVAGGDDPSQNNYTAISQWDIISVDRVEHFVHTMPRVIGWASFGVCVVAFASSVAWAKPQAAVLAWPLVSYYLFTVTRGPAQLRDFDRPFLPVALILALFGGWLLAQLATFGAWRRVRWRFVPRAAVATVFAVATINAAAMIVTLKNDPRYEVEHWIQAHVSDGTTIEFYGRKRDTPRIDSTWSAEVVNHDPEDSSLSFEKLFRSDDWIEELERRAPQYVVVCRSYADDFTVHAEQSKLRGRSDFNQIGEFFQQLSSGRTKYVHAACFHPKLARSLGFGEHIVPEVDVYVLPSVGGQVAKPLGEISYSGQRMLDR